MLASDRPSNAYAWATGWTLSTFAVAALVVLVFNNQDFSSGSSASTASYAVELTIGGLLLWAGARFWRRRPARTGKLPKQPKWMKAVGEMRARWVFLLGAFWINVALVLPAANAILQADLSTTDSLIACAVFALLTASVQAAMIIYSLVRSKQAELGLGRIREWIARNQEAAMAVICLALAVWLVSQSVYNLTT